MPLIAQLDRALMKHRKEIGVSEYTSVLDKE
jgi:hypothetical protein